MELNISMQPINMWVIGLMIKNKEKEFNMKEMEIVMKAYMSMVLSRD